MLSSFQVTSLELKLLRSLLDFPHYRAPVSQIRLRARMSITARDRLCENLRKRSLIDYETWVVRFGLTATGRTLLGLDRSVLPVTPDEKYVMRSCQNSSITPGQIHPRVPAASRQVLIQALAQQGLVRIIQRQLGDVWLTEAGQHFLREEEQLANKI